MARPRHRKHSAAHTKRRTVLYVRVLGNMRYFFMKPRAVPLSSYVQEVLNRHFAVSNTFFVGEMVHTGDERLENLYYVRIDEQKRRELVKSKGTQFSVFGRCRDVLRRSSCRFTPKGGLYGFFT